MLVRRKRSFACVHAPPKSIRATRQAWALMAIGYMKLRDAQGGKSNEGMVAADRALAVDPDLAEAHAIKAQILLQDGDAEAAAAEVAHGA